MKFVGFSIDGSDVYINFDNVCEIKCVKNKEVNKDFYKVILTNGNYYIVPIEKEVLRELHILD